MKSSTWQGERLHGNLIEVGMLIKVVGDLAKKHRKQLPEDDLRKFAVEIAKSFIRYFSPLAASGRRVRLTDKLMIEGARDLAASLATAAQAARSLEEWAPAHRIRFDGDPIMRKTAAQQDLVDRLIAVEADPIFEKYQNGLSVELIELARRFTDFAEELELHPSGARPSDLKGRAARSSHPEFSQLIASLAQSFELVAGIRAKAWRSSSVTSGETKNYLGEFVSFVQRCWEAASLSNQIPGPQSIKNALKS